MKNDTDRNELTRVLEDVRAGTPGAQDLLFDRVYTELHRMASAAWRSVPPGDTLQPTALVHEMYTRLFHEREASWVNRAHFFSAAARAMHDILVEQARRHASLKRGGKLQRVPLMDDEPVDITTQAVEMLALQEAIGALSQSHPDAARVVMLRVFAGMQHGEIAMMSDCAEATVRRRWAFARAWMKSYLDRHIS